MKTIILFLALCVSAYAAPLPPMPVAPAVTRPAPLISPKAASAPKTVAMLKFTPASVGHDIPGLAPTALRFETNVTIIQIDGTAVQRDVARVFSIQRVGKGIRVEYTDGVPSAAGPWEFLADWSPYVGEQIIVTERYTDPAYRAQARFYRVVEYSSTGMRVASGSPVRVNPALINEVKTWRMSVPK